MPRQLACQYPDVYWGFYVRLCGGRADGRAGEAGEAGEAALGDGEGAVGRIALAAVQRGGAEHGAQEALGHDADLAVVGGDDLERAAPAAQHDAAGGVALDLELAAEAGEQ